MLPRLAAVFIAERPTFVSRAVPSAFLKFGGLEGDRHSGISRPSCSRTPWHKRGTEIANTRQISLVAIEDCREIALRLGVPSVDPRLLGANLLLEGIEQFTALPPSTRLQFPSGATLFITEENRPCRLPGRELALEYNEPRFEMLFPKVAAGLRGVVALVESPGEVAAGDACRVIIPAAVRESLGLRLGS